MKSLECHHGTPARRRAALAHALLLALCLGCAASQPMLRGHPIKDRIAILLRVSDEAAKTDDLGGIAAIVDTISTKLAERGVQTEVFAADDDHPSAPRIEVWVEKWAAMDRGDRGVGWTFGIVGQMALAGEYRVVCKVYGDDETEPVFVNTYSGVVMGIEESASADKGESVGSTILSEATRPSSLNPTGSARVASRRLPASHAAAWGRSRSRPFQQDLRWRILHDDQHDAGLRDLHQGISAGDWGRHHETGDRFETLIGTSRALARRVVPTVLAAPTFAP